MNKKSFAISVVILVFASIPSFADFRKKQLSESESTAPIVQKPLTQRPLTLPFNKTFSAFSEDIVRNYEARRKTITHPENEYMQASRDRFKKEPRYILRGKV